MAAVLKMSSLLSFYQQKKKVVVLFLLIIPSFSVCHLTFDKKDMIPEFCLEWIRVLTNGSTERFLLENTTVGNNRE
jgi:hypothetical protein